jgi:hypothetical protein
VQRVQIMGCFIRSGMTLTGGRTARFTREFNK